MELVLDPNKKIRVEIVGEHPWSGHRGWIEPLPEGGYKSIRVLGTGPEMLLVQLDNNEGCYAETKELRFVGRMD